MKKHLIFFAGLFLITLTSLGQTQPAEATSQVKSCEQSVNFSVDDMLLKAQVGQSLAKPETNPRFKGGLDELKKYFGSHSLTDTRAKDIVFRVHIGFVVNCNGQAGNFQIASKGKGYLQELAQQVLTVIKDMPQNWQPASVDNKTVDCYQILSFTVVSGALDKVSYR